MTMTMTSHNKFLKTAFLCSLLIAGMIVALSSCTPVDLYGEKFNAIAIGDSRASVIATLGEPDSLASIEGPLVIKFEQLAWRSRLWSGRVYTIVTVLDRVAGKTIIQ